MKKRVFFSFVGKEFRHIFRDSRSTLILLFMPLILIFLLSYALSTDVRNVRLVYMSASDDPMVEKILARVGQSEYFTLVGRVYDIDGVIGMMQRNKADIALRFSDAQGLQVIVDASNPNVSASSAMYLQSIVMQEIAESGGSATVSAGAAPSVRMLYNPRMQSSYNFIPGILGMILILICAMMTSVSIVREKETGTMEVLLSSPARPVNIVLSKMVPYFVISFVDVTVILVVARYVMGIPIAAKSVGLILVMCIVYIVLSLSLGLLISTLTDKQATALIFSAIVLLVPVMMFSGMLFPLESMPGIFRAISCIVPARYFIDAMRKLMIESLGFRFVFWDLMILLGMVLLFITVALRNFKTRLE